MLLPGARVSITGIGGFIGLRFAERAAELGMHVRGLDLDPAGVRRARDAGFEVDRGSIDDVAATEALCADADIVFHSAAVVYEGGSLAQFRRVNVDGTHRMAHAARHAGVRRFVQLSSVMVYGFDFPPYVQEHGPFRGDKNPYCQTKIESEAAAMSHHGRDGLDVVIIRPGDVYGPGSIPWIVRPVQLMQRGMFYLPDGGKGCMNHVYIDNLIDAVFLALERDVVGEAFNVTDGYATTFLEFYTRVAAMIGKTEVGTLPRWVLERVIATLSMAAKARGKDPPADASAIRFITRPHPYSIAKARTVLGYEPRVHLDEGLERTRVWLRAQDSTSAGSAEAMVDP